MLFDYLPDSSGNRIILAGIACNAGHDHWQCHGLVGIDYQCIDGASSTRKLLAAASSTMRGERKPFTETHRAVAMPGRLHPVTRTTRGDPNEEDMVNGGNLKLEASCKGRGMLQQHAHARHSLHIMGIHETNRDGREKQACLLAAIIHFESGQRTDDIVREKHAARRRSR
jgi:hypothetical protein